MRFWLAALVCSFPAVAAANGRPPAPVSTALEPAPGQRLMVGTTFGLLASSDGGTSWRWICEQAIYNSLATAMFDPRYLISPTGTIYAALPSGLSISRDGGCSWQLAGGPLTAMWIDDVAVSPADAQTVYVGTSTTGMPNGLFISHDDGRNWTAVPPLDQAYYRRVVAAGSDAWISGYDSTTTNGVQHLWKYTGATGTIAPVTGYTGLEQAQAVLEYVAASQKTPGLLYLHARVSVNDALFKSTDGGMSFTQVLQTAGLGGQVLDADDTLWVATTDGVKFTRDGGVTWMTGASIGTLTCLGKRGATLYACSTQIADWSFGQSPDGRTFSGLLQFQTNLTDVLSCPAGSITHDMCAPLWPMLKSQLGMAGQGDGGAPADGGSINRQDGGAGAGGGGGGCSVGGSFAIGAGVLLAFAGIALLLGRRPPS